MHIQMFIYVTSCSYLVWWFLPPLSCLSINCVFWLLFTSCLDSCCWCVGWNISSLLIAGLEAQFSSVVVVWKIKSVIAHYRILLIRIILYFITLVLSLDIVCQKDCIMFVWTCKKIRRIFGWVHRIFWFNSSNKLLTILDNTFTDRTDPVSRLTL